MRGHDREEFLRVFRSEAVRQETRGQFLRGREPCRGVMPTLIGERGGRTRVLSAGFAKLEDFLPTVGRRLYGMPGGAEVHRDEVAAGASC